MEEYYSYTAEVLNLLDIKQLEEHYAYIAEATLNFLDIKHLEEYNAYIADVLHLLDKNGISNQSTEENISRV